MSEMNSNQSINKGFAADHARRAKALKILKVIEDAGKAGNSSLKLLDIGTGNGSIAFYLAQYFDVTSVDVVDQRRESEGYSFCPLDGERLPFDAQSFDIVISNHVIEHVADADVHLAEIGRVLKPNGLVYLATPNRLWPWEVHYRVPLLQYLPQPWFMRVLKFLNRYHEELQLLSWFSLKAKAGRYFTIRPVSDAVCKWPKRYYLNVNDRNARILAWVPLAVFRGLVWIHPTLIAVLRPKSGRSG